MDILELGISLLLTIVVYLLFPLIYSYVNGKVSPKKGRIISLINSIVCATLFCIIRGLISGWDTAVTSLAPAVFYYFIAKLILIDKYIETDKDKLENSTFSKKVLKCDNCNYQLFGDETECPWCHTKLKPKNINSNTVVNERPNPTKNKQTIIKNIKKVFNLQISVVALFILLISFSIIFPITISSTYKNSIPNIDDAQVIKLSNLDPTKDTFCELGGRYNYVYQKTNKGIQVYKFYNSSSTGAYNATSTQLKDYFSGHIYSGKPSLDFIYPFALPVGVVTPVLFLIVIGVLLFHINKSVEDFLRILGKKDKYLTELKNKFNNDDISKTELKKSKQDYFSSKVMKNNRLMSIFKILY